MVQGKREHDCDVSIWHVKLIADMFTGKLNLSTANPFREIVEQVLDETVKQDKLDTGMKLIGQGLARMFGKKLKKRKKRVSSDNDIVIE